MSDPVTNAEVEDVLSSIRRLVSEEKRPLQSAKPAPEPVSEPVAEPDVQSDRLVLTPALRVAEAAPETSAETSAPEQSETATQDAFEKADVFDDPFENPADGFDDLSGRDETSADMPEDDYRADPYGFEDDADKGGEIDTPLSLSQTTRTESDTAAKVAADPTADSKAATLSAKIEALESALGGSDEEFEPDEAGTDAYAGTDAPAMAWEDDLEEDVFESADLEVADVEVADLEDADFDRTDDKPSGFETSGETLVDQFVQDSDDDVEPPSESRDQTVFGAAMAEDDDAEPFSFDGDDQLIDEEALRDLVSEIVRAELQGALGERITRNVRKLVRREIHRALTTQDLE